MSTAGPSSGKRRNSAQPSSPQKEAATSASQPRSIPRVKHEELAEVLDWFPPRLADERVAEYEADKQVTASTSTRPPAFYDKHLCDSQTLKNLIHLPTLTNDLRNIVSDYIENEDGTPRELPPRRRFTGLKYIDTLATKNPSQICSEEGVRARYFLYISTPFLPMASTLALGLDDWGQHFLSFDVSSTKQKCAVADGFVKMRFRTDDPPVDELWKERLSWVAEAFPNVAVWEFKSLTAATSTDFEDIIRLSHQKHDFPWQKCTAPNLCWNHFQPDGTETRTSVAMGLDSTEPTCKLRQDQPRMGTGEDPYLNILTRPDHPVHLVQQMLQAWTEAVVSDATFIIIHAGNFEIIGYRVRKTSTLYISDIIEVPQRGYARLQVGLYLAILRDAVNRAVQLKVPGLPPESWRRFKSGKGGKRVKSTKRKTTEAELLKRQAIARRAAFQQEQAILHWSPKGGNFLPGSNWGPFTRENGAPLSTTPGNLFIDVGVDEIAACVYDAKLRFNGIRWDKRLVLKWGHNDDDYRKLGREFESYERLKIHEILDAPGLMGSFVYDQTPELRHRVLLMQNVGITLRKHGEGVTIRDRIAFIRLLSRLHEAGYLHGNLTEKSLLYDEGRVRFVGFGAVKKIQSEDEKEREHDLLADLLNEIELDHRHETPKRPHPQFELAAILGPITADILEHREEIDAQIASNDFTAEVEQDKDILIIRFAEVKLFEDSWGPVSRWLSDYRTQNLPRVPFHFCWV